MFKELILDKIFDNSNNESSNAFCIDGVFYTYLDFKKEVYKISKYLTQNEIIHQNVCIVGNDDIYTYASIFAIWMNHNSYIPLNPKHPLSRNKEILDLIDTKIILSSTPFIIDNKTISIISTNNISSLFHYEDLNYSNEKFDNEIAYTIFTSGSTGSPKGVPISKKSLVEFVKAFSNTPFKITDHDYCLQCYDLNFDASVQAYLIPLINGACIFTVPANAVKYTYIANLINDYKLTVCGLTPSMIKLLEPFYDEIDFSGLKYCMLLGEASDLMTISKFWEYIPNASIFNFYGPTECTVYCSYHKLNKNNIKHFNGIISIGNVFENTEYIIIDENDQVVKFGDKGELCINSPQLTSGYIGENIDNSLHFISIDNKTYYKTGDICFTDSENDLMYCYRKDFQIKINGYRIELGEIEYKCSKILNSPVIAFAFEHYKNLDLAIAIETNASINEQDLISKLRLILPAYMIPSKVACFKNFPLNSNGKTDRKTIINTLKNNVK